MSPNDPDVIALSKAIFQRESGGDFNAVGDAGTSHGAGQWQAPTWKSQAKDVLGNENAPMTPDNQKAVIQVTIAKRKAEGLNPAQIAAEWNSGKTRGWENHVGTTTINGQQIHYDTPKYVKDVTELYHQYKGQSSPQNGSLLQGSNTSQPQSPLLQGGQGDASVDAKLQALMNTPQTPEQQDSLSGKIQGRAQDAMGALGLAGQGINETVHGNIGRGLFDIGSGGLQTVGAAAGGVGDAIGSAIEHTPIVGDLYKGATGLIGQGVGKLAQTQLGQSAIQAGTDFSAKHPVVAKDIGSAFNIAGLVGGGIGGKVAKDAVEEGVVQGARKGVLGTLAKDVAQKSATKQAEELLASNPTKGAVKSAVRGGRISTKGGVPSVVNDPMKQASVDEVARAIMEGKIPKGLVADKAAAIKGAADDMAISLEKQLGSMKVVPIVQPEEINTLLEGALKAIGEDPTMVGNAEESAKRILGKFNSYLPKDRPINALDILQARKKLDGWIGGLSGGSNVFDPAYENAKTIALRAIRQGANDLVAAKAPDVAVKELLQRQSNLYRALDYIVPNVKGEIGTTPFGRFAGKHPLVAGGLKTAAKAALQGVGAGAVINKF